MIDQSMWQWRADLVDGLFNEEDAELVKSIPLSHVEAEDVLFWPYTKNGVYTCKSGYGSLRKKLKGKPQTRFHLFEINIYGKQFGRCKFHRRLKCLYGGPVEMQCRLNTR